MIFMNKKAIIGILLGLMCVGPIPSKAAVFTVDDAFDSVIGATSFTETSISTDGNVGIDVTTGLHKNLVINGSGFKINLDNGLGTSTTGFRTTPTANVDVQNGDFTVSVTGDNGTYIGIHNKGNLTFHKNVYLNTGVNERTGSYTSIKNEAGATINFNGDLLINLENIIVTDHYIDANGMEHMAWVATGTGSNNMPIENWGTMNISGNYFWNTGNLVGGAIIQNHGVLNLNADNICIEGDIIHYAGAVTNIVMKKFSRIDGSLLGTDENFHLTMNPRSYLYLDTDQYHDSDSATIHGIKMNGGQIWLERYPIDNRTLEHFGVEEYNAYWNSIETRKLTLVNFQSDGTGSINLRTDLKNNKGDKVVFRGTTPDVIPIKLINKDNNGGVNIKPEDGYKVNIVDLPSANNTVLDTKLCFVYNSSNYVCEPILSSEVTDDFVKKYWFVGWTTGNQRALEDEKKGQNIDPYLGIRDMEPNLKRLNDIRTDPSEVGVWLRGETGKTQIRNYKYDFNLMSGGYDWDYENEARHLFTGFGICYSTNDCDEKLIGDAKSLGFNLYASWLGKKNHDFFDVILKYGKMDKDYAGYDMNNVFVSGKYDKNVFALATKIGRRYDTSNGWYYEPTVGLTYGRVGSASYTDSQN